MAEVVPLRRREDVELPPRPEPPRKIGARLWWVLVALLIASAGLAAATGLSRWLEGPIPTGDHLPRWLLVASAVSAACGAVAALLHARAGVRRWLWPAWGAASPFVVAAAVLGIAAATRPLRHRVADLDEQRCRAEGRAVCTLTEFQRACKAGARDKLGAPVHSLCDAAGCTRRFRYDGPWTPDSYVPPGALLCSVVTDADEKVIRVALTPAPPLP